MSTEKMTFFGREAENFNGNTSTRWGRWPRRVDVEWTPDSGFCFKVFERWGPPPSVWFSMGTAFEWEGWGAILRLAAKA